MRRRSVVLLPPDDWGWRDVRSALKRLPEVEVAGVARSVGEARSLAAERPIDALVAADRLNGRSLVADLVGLRPLLAPGAKLVVLAERLDAEAVAGLDDFALDGLFLWSRLTRETLPLVLGAALQTDMIGGSHEAVRAFLSARRRLSAPSAAGAVLTDRERTVLQGLIEDQPRGIIAASVGVSSRTVDRIIDELKGQLGTQNAYAVGYRAAELGLL